MKNQIIIPVSSTHPEEQLQALVMALIHSYGLTTVLGEMHDGLHNHYEQGRMDYKVQGPILDSINVAWTVADQLLEKNQTQK